MESETMYSEVYATFDLFGPDLDPEKVTALVGITPFRAWKVGDPLRPPATGRQQRGGWILKSELPLSADLEDHVKSVLERLRPNWLDFVQLGVRHEAILSCVIETHGGDRPAISFDKAVVKYIAELNAAIDIDLYVFD